MLFREEFADLDHWKHVFLSKTKTPTKYLIEVNQEDHHLKAESNASASALVHQTLFNVYQYPNVRWQWMIMNVYQQGDTRTKTGDNSPLRIYVLFEHQPDTFDGFERAIYDIAKLLHGEYLPYAALCYFWDNQPTDDRRISPSPNVDRVKMIALQGGTGKIGTWQEERINIVEDYLQAFGKRPPPMAQIGIMNDSDFTGEHSISYLRFLEVYR